MHVTVTRWRHFGRANISPAKPLAVMLPVAEGLPDAARQLLTTPAAPIVLVDKKYVPELCDDIAPDLNEVGVMLPANPLQHLLLQELQCPLVMTSGNYDGGPGYQQRTGAGGFAGHCRRILDT